MSGTASASSTPRCRAGGCGLFYACIIWAVGYWVLYPAWPLIIELDAGRARLARARRGRDRPQGAARAARSDGGQARRALRCRRSSADTQLLDFARAEGRVAFADNCAPCHGAGGGGAKGYPNLNDDDWLWGGKLAQIEQTIIHGARSGDDKGHQGDMTGLRPRRHPEARADLAGRRLRALAVGIGRREGRRSRRRQADLRRQLRGLSRPRRQGQAQLGSANLTDKIWLYGSDKETIVQTITNGRGGVMPAWGGRLSDPTIKALTVYVWTFGGGVK